MREARAMNQQDTIISLTETYSAHNYHPLPVVLTKGEGVWVWDVEGRRYLDCLSAYSALNQGHRHPAIIDALTAQAGRITLTSRAFHNDRMGKFLQLLCKTAGMEMALPMNTGAEAVETAIKAARKWGYTRKGVPQDQAEIIVCNENFHGRTTTAVSLSSDPDTRRDFGPFTPGFKWVPFGDAAALAEAMTENTVALILEPIQGEAGINVPPDGYLRECRRICDRHNALFVVDEIQTGLGRTGALFCHQHEDGADPDMMILGKALGGGVYPVSAVVSSREILGVFQPGDHGSTFGGNPLACEVARASLRVILDEGLAERSRYLGARLYERLRSLNSPRIKEVRGRGLMIGVEIDKAHGPARPICEALMRRGVLCKETHEQVIRLAPPLVIQESEIDWLGDQMAAIL
ncbi:ornithine--oxo-acid transaminase [Ferruginivarius sediminum]|uniref:ornithine aminotransferase n=2 Tax=Ferruginivarius sediminum TaxID=2661937 RepID=A0A369TD80_9PROT|nr:ornithine--oxo-acid transaminase [Ferruginivarius sediminum]